MVEKQQILIIDDDPNIRKTLSDILKVKGYEPLIAKNGAEGLELLRQSPVNLVMIDLGLPDMSGLEVLSRVKADHPSTEAIILTGNASLGSAIEATNKGAFSYLQKPYEIDPLLLHIRRALEKHEAGEKIVRHSLELEKMNAQLSEKNIELANEIAEHRRTEEALIRIRKAVESSGEAISISNPQGSHFYQNKAFLHLFEYSVEELNKPLAPIVIYADPEVGREVFETIMQGDPWVGETIMVAKSGRSFPVFLRADAVKDCDGAIIGLIGIHTDITERKRAEQRLSEEVALKNFLLDLNEKAPALTDKGLYDYVLDHVVRLTDSAIGFFHLVSDDQKNVILTTWNKEALKGCTASYATHYPLDQAGNWVDCVRFRRPVVYNEFSSSPNQKGLPGGHSPVRRFMSIPVVEGDNVRIIFGVGNKYEEYSELDAGRIQVVANDLQKIMARRQAEEKIKASLREKETLLKEIHHRVKNNLQVISSLLSLQSRYLEDKRLLEIFRESENRVKTMALVHKLLYQSEDLSAVGFDSFISNLAGFLLQSYRTDSSSIKVNLDVHDIQLDIVAAIPFGLILNELISNALKHAFPGEAKGEISLVMQVEGDRVVARFQDSGVGFPETLDFRNTQSLGLQLVNILVGQLRGTIELAVDGGTIFNITFPIPGEKKE